MRCLKPSRVVWVVFVPIQFFPCWKISSAKSAAALIIQYLRFPSWKRTTKKRKTRRRAAGSGQRRLRRGSRSETVWSRHRGAQAPDVEGTDGERSDTTGRGPSCRCVPQRGTGCGRLDEFRSAQGFRFAGFRGALLLAFQVDASSRVRR